MNRLISFFVNVICVLLLTACPCGAESFTPKAHKCCPSQQKSYSPCQCIAQISDKKFSNVQQAELSQPDLLLSAEPTIPRYVRTIQRVPILNFSNSGKFHPEFAHAPRAPPKV